nr:MAG TPA: hypothetical protein [Caudoviricetes sp.]
MCLISRCFSKNRDQQMLNRKEAEIISQPLFES